MIHPSIILQLARLLENWSLFIHLIKGEAEGTPRDPTSWQKWISKISKKS
jgi:hypothetical protein